MLKLGVEVAACKKDGDFAKALEFVLPYEKFCCQLAEKIIRKSADIFLIKEAELIQGIFYFKEKNTLLCCLPKKNKKIAKSLSDFFCTKSIFALAGKTDYIDFLQKALSLSAKEKRIFFLMRHKKKLCGQSPSPLQNDLVACSKKDASNLMPLHTGFFKEEVLPDGKEIYLPSLLRDLEKLLEKQKMLALKKDGLFVAKVQTNASSKNFTQIGGVYTLPQHRKKGYAEFLTRTITNQICSQEKTPILFVRKENSAALSLYKKCGYKSYGSFCFLYC